MIDHLLCILSSRLVLKEVFAIARHSFPGKISKYFNKGGSRCNTMKWVRDIFKDGDLKI